MKELKSSRYSNGNRQIAILEAISLAISQYNAVLGLALTLVVITFFAGGSLFNRQACKVRVHYRCAHFFSGWQNGYYECYTVSKPYFPHLFLTAGQNL